MAYKFPRKSKYTYRVGKSFAGLGLFVIEEIPKKDEFLIEYFGTRISSDEADKKGGKYLFEVDKNLVIDGTVRKNIARYINHSCKPNCYAEVDGTRVFIFSKRKIKAGEELCYHYGKEYWEDIIQPHGCRCAFCADKKRSTRLRKLGK